MSEKVAIVPPPKRRLQIEPPKPVETPANLTEESTGRLVDLNFKVSEEFRWLFKITAVNKKMTMRELLEASFKHWAAEFGHDAADKPKGFFLKTDGSNGTGE